MDTVIIEIRSAEGGDDAKLFVYDMFKVLVRYCSIHKWDTEILEMKEASKGYHEISFMVTGRDVYNLLVNEAGGHRVQRVPPTEKKGRRQSSTVTVAVLKEPTDFDLQIKPSDLIYETMRGSGPGGQHRNTTDSAVRITHVPTKITAYSASKSQNANKKMALSVLRSRIHEEMESKNKSEISQHRQSQVGSGMRGDKIRTIRYQDGFVFDHRTDKKIRLQDWEDGKLDLLRG